MAAWTTSQLKELFDQRFQDSEKAVAAALAAQESAVAAALGAAERAVLKAETASEKRFECVEVNTLILCSDLVWRPAGGLLPGDELIACDETSPTRSGRRFRRALVTANAIRRDTLLLVTTEAGNVRCNSQHPWLARRDSTQKRGRSHWQWVEAIDLRPGDSVLRAVDTWETDRSWESGWLAGIYDGEGCLSLSTNNLQLTIAQRESLTSERIAVALKDRIGHVPLTYRIEPGTPSTPNNTVPFFHFMVTHRPDVMKLLGSVRPPRLLERADGAWEGKVIAANGRAVTVLSVKNDGMGDIAALSTSTQTYVADGYIMHNSVNEFRATLSDQAAHLMPRPEAQVEFKALRERIDTLAVRVEHAEGRGAGINAGWGYLVGLVGVLAAIAGLASRFFH